MTNPAPDHYALDDTLAGRIAQAATVGILTALPDYFRTKAGLTTAYLAGGAASFGLVAFANGQRETDEMTLPEPPANEPFAYLLVIAVIALIALDVWLSVGICRALARGLAKRGIAKPWTVLGAVGAALTFAVSEAEARDIEKQAK